MLLSDWLSTWLNLYKTELRTNTRKMYRVAINAVTAAFPDLSLDNLDITGLLQLRSWQVTRARTAPRAAQIERTMLHQAIRKAQVMGLFCSSLDVAEILPPIKHQAAETAIFSEDELLRYIGAVISSGEPLGIPLLLCCCGLRRGEALGVRWQDWARPVLSINGAVCHGVYGPPKSKAGRRALIVPSGLADLIDQQPRTLRSPYICPATEKQLYRAHKAVMKWADLQGVTIHGLRHSFAMMAASKGVSIKLLQTELGHSKISLTADLYAGHQYKPSPLPAQILQEAFAS